MKLKVFERIILLNLLPTEGNVVTLRVVRDLQSALSFSEDEIKQYRIQSVADAENRVNITWDVARSLEEKDVKIGDVAKTIIREKLVKLDEEKKLTLNMLSIYEKFVCRGRTASEKEAD